MNGSLDASFGENRYMFWAKVVGRNSRCPRNDVTTS
jgi:hypothetical protein